jgi:hypothetical protein
MNEYSLAKVQYLIFSRIKKLVNYTTQNMFHDSCFKSYKLKSLFTDIILNRCYNYKRSLHSLRGLNI